MLSALVQSQAAIIAIVISLTLIAVQLTASAYSPRVISIFRHSYGWQALFVFYGISIFYGLLVLKMIKGADDLSPITYLDISLEGHISIAYALGCLTFAMLIMYLQSIINFLNPASIINRLTTEITKDNLLNSKEDPIQPIVDIVHGSIMKYDIETTRVGLKAVTDRVTKIIESDREVEISSHFCHHLERISRLAMSKLDEDSVREVIESIGNFGLSTARKGLGVSAWWAVASLGSVGGDVARNGFGYATQDVVEFIGAIGKVAAERGLGNPIGQALRGLRYIGKITIERDFGAHVAESLANVGTTTAKNELENETKLAARYLAELTILSEEIKDDIQNYEKALLEEKDHVFFQKFMKMYEQELEKTRAEKSTPNKKTESS